MGDDLFHNSSANTTKGSSTVAISGASETHTMAIWELNRHTNRVVYYVFNNERIVRGLYGFVEPFCFHSDIKKAIVIHFTSTRFVDELFALLSGLSKDVVPGNFEQSYSTMESAMSMDFLSMFASNV
jgi:hypothetical protein